MAKFLRFIGFLLIALAVWPAVGEAFAAKSVSEGECFAPTVEDCSGRNLAVSERSAVVSVRSFAADGRDIALQVQDGASIAMPQLPYLPDAELAGSGGQLRLLMYSRMQRLSTTEYVFSLKGRIDKLARWESALSLHREKLYDATAYYCCQPVCEYYIFTLRRILI